MDSVEILVRVKSRNLFRPRRLDKQGFDTQAGVSTKVLEGDPVRDKKRVSVKDTVGPPTSYVFKQDVLLTSG